MGNYGIKITVPGKGIASSDNKDYVFWSKYPVMKTYLVGTSSYTFPSDLNSVQLNIVHNLGTRKVGWLSIDGTTQNAQWATSGWWAYWYSSGGNTALRWWTYHTYTNSMSIHYDEAVVRGSGYNPTGEDWDFKYYVFIEGIN